MCIAVTKATGEVRGGDEGHLQAEKLMTAVVLTFTLDWTHNKKNTAILSTSGVLLYLPHHLDLASEDSVGHSTCMSVLARRRAIMGSVVQPKRSCLGLSRCCHVLVTVHAGVMHVL